MLSGRRTGPRPPGKASPPFCQATHCLPLPRKPGTFSKSVSWNKIKCELLSGVGGTMGRPRQQGAPWTYDKGPGSGCTPRS